MNNDYAVIGLSAFGQTIAMELEASGGKVTVLDRNADRIQAISQYVSKAVCADAQNQEVIDELGITSCAAVVITMPNFFHTSVLLTHYLAQQGLERIYVHVTSEEEAAAIRAVGATNAVIPDVDVGLRMAAELIMPGAMDRVLLKGHLAIARIPCPQKWAGSTLRKINPRKKYKVNVISVLPEGGDEKSSTDNGQGLAPDPDQTLHAEDVLVVVATTADLAKFQKTQLPDSES